MVENINTHAQLDGLCTQPHKQNLQPTPWQLHPRLGGLGELTGETVNTLSYDTSTHHHKKTN